MNTRLKCLILDDEIPGLTYLKMLCEQMPELEVVKAFDNPEIFLQEISDLDFDFCILDIEMPGMSGIELAKRLNGKPVIFITAYKEYAAEAFDIDAIDYLRKPATKERLNQAIAKMDKHLKTKSSERQFIQHNTDKGKTLIFFNQLRFIKTSEIDARDKIAYLADGSVLTLKNVSFSALFDQIPKKQFIRINKQEVISIDAILSYTFDEIITNLKSENGQNLKLTLSEIYRSEFLEKVAF